MSSMTFWVTSFALGAAVLPATATNVNIRAIVDAEGHIREETVIDKDSRWLRAPEAAVLIESGSDALASETDVTVTREGHDLVTQAKYGIATNRLHSAISSLVLGVAAILNGTIRGPTTGPNWNAPTVPQPLLERIPREWLEWLERLGYPIVFCLAFSLTAGIGLSIMMCIVSRRKPSTDDYDWEHAHRSAQLLISKARQDHWTEGPRPSGKATSKGGDVTHDLTKGKGKPLQQSAGQTWKSSGKPSGKGHPFRLPEADAGHAASSQTFAEESQPAMPARADEQAPSSQAEAQSSSAARRAPELRDRIAIKVEVKNGKDMPSVNTFGGCDPFVEVRCVKGDPSKKCGDLETIPKDAGQTKPKDGTLHPVWNETLTLQKVTFDNDIFVNVVLWDSGITGNTPIGYKHVPITDLLDGLTYDANSDTPIKKEFVASSFHSILADRSKSCKATVNMAFQYFEVHKFKFSIKAGHHLPRVDTFGSIDAFVECRLVDGDPSILTWEKNPGKEVAWSAKTKTVNDNQDPTFNEELSVTAPADPTKNFVLAVIDAGTLANTPVGMVVIPMKGLCGDRRGESEFNEKLIRIPGFDPPAHLSHARLKFKLSHDIATA